MSEVGSIPKAAESAVALRLAGAGYEDIARTVGYSTAAQARDAVERGLALRARDADPEKRELLRAQSGARLERLLQSVWGKALDQNDPEHLSAVRTAAALIDRHTRLYGLDAPTEVMVHTPTQQAIEEWVSAMLGATPAVQVREADVVVIPGEVVVDE